jgi:hypothetical protein
VEDNMGDLRTALALAQHNVECGCPDEDLPLHDHQLREKWFAAADAAMTVVAELARHQYWNSGRCECGWEVDKVGDVNWQRQFTLHVGQSIAEACLAPVLAERDAQIERLKRSNELLGNGLQESAYAAKDALQLSVDLEDARAELERERESKRDKPAERPGDDGQWKRWLRPEQQQDEDDRRAP